MNGPWKSEEELIEAMMYWQNRALNAEKDLDSELEFVGELIQSLLLEREVSDQLTIELGRRIVAIKYLKNEL